MSSINMSENLGLDAQIPVNLGYLFFGLKGCRSIYNNFIETEWKILEEVQSKWSAALNYGIEHHLIENAFKNPWKMTQDSYLIYIQYKILHHRVATNDILLKWLLRQIIWLASRRHQAESLFHKEGNRFIISSPPPDILVLLAMDKFHNGP